MIGIDRYRHWPVLSNAVRDATCALDLFLRLGFEQISAPLLDERATGGAIQALVTDDLMSLGPDDSLVLFYAGHGGTRKHHLGGQAIKTGYLIPIDASDSPNHAASWVELDSWLRAVALLPAKHILVILDACHSGLALDPIIKWRDIGPRQEKPASVLQTRRSRRVITSALDDEVALDSGPIYGNSLFTGCLIEALTHGIGQGGRRATTGSELGLYLQKRVKTYPGSRQTPDFGTFAFDDRGEIEIPLASYSERFRETKLLWPSMPRSIPATPPELIPPSAPRPSSAITGELETEQLPEQNMPDRRRWLFASAVVVGLVLTMLVSRISRGVSTSSGAPASSLSFEIPSVDDLSRLFCPEGMVHIPSASFQMGSREWSSERDETDEHPQHEVRLSAYCIDQTEVTVSKYGDCVAAGACSSAPLTANWSGRAGEDVSSSLCNGDGRANHPMNCIDWNQASTYCTWIGKRLPTEAEWEYAARGGDDRLYPWNNVKPDGSRLNAAGSESIGVANREGIVMYQASDSWASTAPVGSFPGGASPFGVFDMAGNVWEWTSDRYGDYPASPVVNPQGASADARRVARGGGWADYLTRWVRAAKRRPLVPALRSYDVGFRCALGL